MLADMMIITDTLISIISLHSFVTISQCLKNGDFINKWSKKTAWTSSRKLNLQRECVTSWNTLSFEVFELCVLCGDVCE